MIGRRRKRLEHPGVADSIVRPSQDVFEARKARHHSPRVRAMRLSAGDPVPQGQAHDGAPVDASRRPDIDVLDGGLRILQARLFQQAL